MGVKQNRPWGEYGYFLELHNPDFSEAPACASLVLHFKLNHVNSYIASQILLGKSKGSLIPGR